MGRQLHKLNPLQVQRISAPGLYGDGGNLHLRVSATLAKSWVFRYSRRDMGLGSFPAVTLADARRAANDARELLAGGVDPIEHRRAASAPVHIMTFDGAAAAYVEAHAPGWRNAKHKQQWENTLATYAAPVIGQKDVREISTEDCLKVLKPIWTAKPETASRVRGRLEAVLDWCAAKGHRDRDRVNPAAWKGNLKHLLSKRDKTAVEHHAAMPWREVPAFVAELRTRDAVAARAVELIILTACRTSEVLNAVHGEVRGDLFVIPGKRMKGGREHIVPLVPRAAEIISTQPVLIDSPYIFPGQRKGRPLSNMAGEMLLRRMGRGDVTVHGFRSSFTDWAAECTDGQREIADMCLSHLVGSEVDRAYRRSELLAKRRALLEKWCKYCMSV